MKRRFVQWTIREITVLRKLASQRGLSANAIHKMRVFPRHTLPGISGQMNYLGLGNPEHKMRVKNRKRTDSATKARLFDFIKGEGRLMPAADVAERFGIDPRMVMYYRRKIGLKLPSTYRFSSKVFVRTHQGNVTKMSLALKRYFQRLWDSRHEELLKLFHRTSIMGQRAPYKKCIRCGSVWYATQAFFYRVRVRPDGTVRLHTHCRACGHVFKKNRKAVAA
jgi:hypothetical protein